MANNGSMGALQTELCRAANGRSLPRLASDAQSLANRVWGVDAPEIDEDFVRNLKEKILRPPSDGRAFRALLCALEIPLTEALALIGYWPDLRQGTGESVTAEQLIVEGCAAAGVKVRVQQRQGSLVVLEVL